MKNDCQTISITIPILKISKSSTNYVHDTFKAQMANPKSEFKGGRKWDYLLRKHKFLK